VRPPRLIEWQECKFEHDPRGKYTQKTKECTDDWGRGDGEHAEIDSKIEVGTWECLEDCIAEEEVPG
jgi:hypothetical protein